MQCACVECEPLPQILHEVQWVDDGTWGLATAGTGKLGRSSTLSSMLSTRSKAYGLVAAGSSDRLTMALFAVHTVLQPSSSS